jgi:Fur family ferric uptake transcriptional regulator
MTHTTRELIFYPSWTAGREGYATRIHEVFQKFLADQGLRLTNQRKEIVDFLLHSEQHVTMQDVYQALKAKGIGKVTVFRTLKMLEECRLAERVTTPGGRAKFEIKYERPHHDHLICIECGRIREVQWPDVERIQEKTCKAMGFEPIWHRHEMFGRCESCQTKRTEKGFQQ